MRARHTILILAAVAVVSGPPAVPAAPPADGGSAGGEQVGIDLDRPEIDDLLLNREQYFYSSFGRRDPFGSLLKGRFASTGEDDLLDVGELSLVGVVWGDADKFAVVEDKRDRSHVLREGDRVVNGRVISIGERTLTVAHYFFGETTTVTITMQEGEDSNDAR